MAASSDLQALQLEIRNLQQKLDWKQLKINQLETKVRDLRDGGLVVELERLERSLCRLSLQMEHVQSPLDLSLAVSLSLRTVCGSRTHATAHALQ